MKTKVWMVLLGGCLAAGLAQAANQAKFDAAYAAAVEAQQKAASVSGEWRDIAKFLKQAEELAKAGEFDAAVKLAKKAERQGHSGYEQMVSQQGKVGPEPFLR